VYQRHPVWPVKSRASTSKRKRTLAEDIGSTDSEDKNFAGTATEDGSDEDSDDVEISNEEVRCIYSRFQYNAINHSQLADMLPSKTVPEVHAKHHTLKPKANARITTARPKKKVRACSVEVEGIEDNDSPRKTAVRNVTISPTSSFHISNHTNVCYLSCFVS
jgi:hypothetical protein